MTWGNVPEYTLKSGVASSWLVSFSIPRASRVNMVSVVKDWRDTATPASTALRAPPGSMQTYYRSADGHGSLCKSLIRGIE